MLYSIVSVIVIILDQLVKNWIADTLPSTDVVIFIPKVISLVNVQNDGAAFGFLSGGGARIYFIIITGVFTVAVILALATNFISGRLSRWSLVLITAGGLSNCIDRIIYGYVQDMFKVELFNFAIFNVADIFITVFALVFVLAMIFERQEDDEDEYYDEEEEEQEEKPKRERKPLLSRFKREDSLDEDDDDAQETPRARRKSRKPDYEEEYEQYKAQRAAREQAQRRQAPSAAAPRPAADPFAEWEQANAKLGVKPAAPAPAYRKPAQQPAAEPVVEAPPVRKTQPTYQAAPKTPAAPVAPAVPKAPASDGGDFSLDDILAEFK